MLGTQAGRWPVIQVHSETESMTFEYFLDLREGLLAKVRRPQEFNFGSLHEVTDVHDVFCLQAVGGTNCKLELVDRAQEDWVHMALSLGTNAFFLTLQVNKDGQLILEDASGAADRFFRIDRAVRFDIDEQLVKVGTLFNTGRFDVVRHTNDRAERRIKLQTTDRTRLLLEIPGAA